LLPPAIVLLLTGSAFARRKAIREDEPTDDD